MPQLVNHYTFDHPADGEIDTAVELDLGSDATSIQLLNGAPRVADGAWGGSQYALETRQISTTPTNDDWKAGVFFDSSTESTLIGTNHVTGVTLMGWFKPLGNEFSNPSPNTNTTFPFDQFNAFGLVGLLRGDEDQPGTDGHSVRALIEVIDGRLVGLGRRLDGQNNSGRAQSVAPWFEVLQPNEWTHISATFDFDLGEVQLYRNGLPLEQQSLGLQNWETTEDTDYTSSTNAGGIKIGGSHPNNSMEQNPFNGRLDELMIFNTVLNVDEVQTQFLLVSGLPGDRDNDGDVDGADFLAIQRGEGDFLAAWESLYGKGVGESEASAASVPEPGSLWLTLSLPCWARRKVLRLIS